VLAAAEGGSSKEITAELGCSHNTVGKWRGRFARRGFDGSQDEPRPGKPRTIRDDDVERVIVKTLEEQPASATHWSTRSMAAATGMSQSAISRIWRAFGLKPQQTEAFKLSPDPRCRGSTAGNQPCPAGGAGTSPERAAALQATLQRQRAVDDEVERDAPLAFGLPLAAAASLLGSGRSGRSPRRRQVMKAIASISAATAVVALCAFAFSAGAGAATTNRCVTGVCGEHSTTWASCDTTAEPAVQVHAPVIKSSYVNYPAYQMTWPNHVQLVGFRSWLLRWNETTRTWALTDQNRDGYADHGPLFQTQVANGNAWVAPSEWLNVNKNQLERGTAFLPVRDHGYYRVRTTYYWAKDQVSPGGFDVLDQTADFFVSTGVTVISTPWCQF
jgi:transposase